MAAPSWCDTLNTKNAEALLRNDAALEEARRNGVAEFAEKQSERPSEFPEPA